VILSDRDIVQAAHDGRILIDPPLDLANLESTALNLRVGDDFRVWKKDLQAQATRTHIDLDNIDLASIIGLTDPILPDAAGVVSIAPSAFVLVRTFEYINLLLLLKAKLAARVEGRSKQARLGMTAHITAPTIHAGFRGKIVLEILNHGPFWLDVRPNQSKLCQLVFEEVKRIPQRGGSASFTDQSTPLGTPKNPR
jgi:dCTP deaminase